VDRSNSAIRITLKNEYVLPIVNQKSILVPVILAPKVVVRSLNCRLFALAVQGATQARMSALGH
jgi:hypothetical protein